MGNEEKNLAKAESQAPSALIQLAIDKGADLDKLEKILALQERWEANEAKKAYNLAIATFKANPPKIEKDKTVKYKDVKYNHASLYNVVEKISSELSKHGLSATWTTRQNGNILVTCKITHEKGHSEETTLSAPSDTTGSKNAIQAIGSTLTYLERYTLLALTGLATIDQDDDGAGTAQVEYIDDNQKNEIIDMLSEKKIDLKVFCKAFGIEELSKLAKSRFGQAKISINAKKGGVK
ncbi:MAG TPA: single-stranded DNA-binding protein [Candidatus Scalindua sp.]|nr:single-stranded DNA-binding protein [Candidatus Scalindua sp.]